MSSGEKIKYLTQKETDRFLKAVKRHGSKRDYAIFRLMYWVGLRASEVGMLQNSDLDLDASTLFVHRLKGSVSHSYQLPSEVSKALKSHCKERSDEHGSLFPSRNHQPISRKRLDALFKHYSQKVRLPKDKRHCHVLRHSIAVHMIDTGIEIRRVAYHLGHRSLTSTMVYAHVSAKASEETYQEMLNSDSII